MGTVIHMDQLAPMLRAIPTLPRPILARLTERLLERLDELDGDCDVEEDDPPGDPLDRGEDEDWRCEGLKVVNPIYAIDQTAGPINEREAIAAYHRHQMGDA